MFVRDGFVMGLYACKNARYGVLKMDGSEIHARIFYFTVSNLNSESVFCTAYIAAFTFATFMTTYSYGEEGKTCIHLYIHTKVFEEIFFGQILRDSLLQSYPKLCS